MSEEEIRGYHPVLMLMMYSTSNKKPTRVAHICMDATECVGVEGFKRSTSFGSKPRDKSSSHSYFPINIVEGRLQANISNP